MTNLTDSEKTRSPLRLTLKFIIQHKTPKTHLARQRILDRYNSQSGGIKSHSISIQSFCITVHQEDITTSLTKPHVHQSLK